MAVAPEAEVERSRREDRGAEGVRCGEGVSPLPTREETGEGLCPLPRKFFDF